MSESRVALVSEQLAIRFDEDGSHYDVLARYQLANHGPRATVTYGVPLFWYPPDLGDEYDPESGTERKLGDEATLRYPQQVHITVNGRAFPCALKDERLVKEEGEQGAHVEAWCVADLDLPAGEVALALAYKGTFRFVDWAFSKSPFVDYARRVLRYDLSPAGGWAGPVQSLEVTIDAGRWADYFHPTAAQPFSRQGNRFSLRDHEVDLKKLAHIDGELDAAPLLKHRDRATMKPDPRFRATASSELKAQGANTYVASNVLDGAPGTAWCAGKGAQGPPWIELRADDIAVPGYCGLNGYVLVPGYAKDQHSWMTNNRITVVRISSCAHLDGKDRATVELSPRFDASAVELPTADPDPFRDAVEEQRADENVLRGQKLAHIKNYCVRLTILEVSAGPAGDTCISELRPIINCG